MDMQNVDLVFQVNIKSLKQLSFLQPKLLADLLNLHYLEELPTHSLFPSQLLLTKRRTTLGLSQLIDSDFTTNL